MVASLIEPLPERYHKLFERAKQVFLDDERVRAMWLTGSLGRGTADAASDLDVAVTVSDEHHDAFTKSWPHWLGDITPTVLAEELPFAPGSFYSVTPGFERFDVLVEKVSAVPRSSTRPGWWCSIEMVWPNSYHHLSPVCRPLPTLRRA